MELQAKFDLLSTHSIERQILKSKSRFYIHGNKTGKILANQLRKTKAMQHITEIRMEDGNMTTDFSQINDTFSNFYNKLYTSEFPSDSTPMQDFLNNLNIPVLSPDSQGNLEKSITKEEIVIDISSLNSGKSPGPDGFLAEFFKSFSSILSPQLCTVLSDSLKLGRLPASFTDACITLTAKKGKDPVDCSSYRPISLLNVDAKILAKVLVLRLENILPSFISKTAIPILIFVVHFIFFIQPQMRPLNVSCL